MTNYNYPMKTSFNPHPIKMRQLFFLLIIVGFVFCETNISTLTDENYEEALKTKHVILLFSEKNW